jgi:hypothetical protein
MVDGHDVEPWSTLVELQNLTASSRQWAGGSDEMPLGVAFKIYYVMAWRAGNTRLLQSTLTRAVIFSAMTNAIAFGSMAASSYPGMSGMGKLMALAWLCTLGAAVLFQPVLMGRPRQLEAGSSPRNPLAAPAE